MCQRKHLRTIRSSDRRPSLLSNLRAQSPWPPMNKTDDELDSENESERRREAALKRMLSTLHKPHAPLGKGTAKRRPRKRASAKPKPPSDLFVYNSPVEGAG